MIKEIKYEDRFKLYDFVNTCDDELIRTFNILWEERNYWVLYQPIVYVVDGEIVGFCAFAKTPKYENSIKIYYLYTHSNFQNKQIGKKLLNFVYDKYRDLGVVYFVYVTEINTGGHFLFDRFKNDERCQFKIIQNEFNTQDYVYKIKISEKELFSI